MKQFSKDLGNVCLAPKGKWSKEQEYERLALVYNACNNLSYVAKINVPIGVEIDNREYWQPMNATGYSDNNFINLTAENENGTITAYESLEEAVATIVPVNRRAGATLSFYNLNSDRLDRQAEFELWQFNSTDLANWENKDYWNNIYYNWNVFVGWYIGDDTLKNHVKIPNVGQYAYVGSNLNDALLYQCRTNGTWTNTGIKVRNYISVVVSGNITIGENGNWFSNGEDTGIPATPAVDEQLDNIITKHESLSRTVQGIAATGGASTATNVTYNNDNSGLNAENAQDAIDELSSIGHFAKRGGVVNISTNYNANHIAEVLTLSQAIAKVPSKDRVLGFQGKFQTSEGWKSYIFIGDSISDWSDISKWTELISSAVLAQELGDSTSKAISQNAVTKKITELDDKVSTQLPAIEEAKNEALNNIKENEQSAITNFNSQRVTPEMLSESTKQLIEASGGGTITNLADDEDITSVDDGTGSNVLKFADRTYNPGNFSGKGYKILRKNIINGKNVLTQDMINQPNTIYEIRYNFDLNNAKINIPNDCSLIFNGGVISNGFIKGNLKGTFTPENFGAKGDGITDDGYAIVNLFNLSENIELKENKTYLINNKIFDNKITIENKSINITGNNSTIIIGENFAEKDTNFNSYKGHIFIKINNVNIKATHLNFKVLTENLYTKTFKEENYLDGDFSLFNITGTSSVNFDNVNSFCEKKRNNLTFLFISSKSPIVKLTNSTIYHDTDSSRGGCIWYMTKGGTKHTLYVDNCNFYNNTADEDIVLSVNNTAYSYNNISITNSNFNVNESCRNSSAFIIYNAPNNDDIFCDILVRNCTFNALNKKDVILRTARICNNINIKIENSSIKTTNNILAYAKIPNPVYFNNCNINIEDVGQEIACIVPDKMGNEIYNINYINCIINCPYLFEEYNFNTNKSLLFKDCVIYSKPRLYNNNNYILTSITTTTINSYIYTPNNVDTHIYYISMYTGHITPSVKTSIIKNTFINNDFIKDSGIVFIKSNNIVAYLVTHNENAKGCLIYDNSIVYDKIMARIYDTENTIELCDIYINDKKYSINRSSREPNLFYYEISTSRLKIGLNIIKIVINNKLFLTKKVYNNNITNEIVNNGLIYNNIIGTFANKPKSSDNISTGFAYFCTDKRTSESESDGIMIYYKGNDVWVDALGRVVS